MVQEAQKASQGQLRPQNGYSDVVRVPPGLYAERRTCSDDSSNSLLQPEDPTLQRSFRGHKDAATCVAFNPTMKQLVSGSMDNCVMVWNFRPQLRAYRFAGHKVCTASLGTVRHYFCLWISLLTSRVLQGSIYSVDFSKVTGQIASASKDRTVRLWKPTVYVTLWTRCLSGSVHVTQHAGLGGCQSAARMFAGRASQQLSPHTPEL